MTGTVDLIVKLEALERGDHGLAGAKAANLGELSARGFPVPPGFVITVAAYRLFAEAADLPARLQPLQHGAGRALERELRAVRAHILAAALPAALRTAITAAETALSAQCPDRIYAVRSSALGEDSPATSFAGQHQTYYDVRPDAIAGMLKHCWASLYSLPAALYRRRQRLSQEAAVMAVLVQQMVPAEVSGVSFTADPLTGCADAVITEASWGLGAAIVDGRVTPDRYSVDRRTLVPLERRIADKRLMVPAAPGSAAAPRLCEVESDRRLQPCLSPAQTVEVARLALAAERIFAAPQDLEWAYAGGRLYLLQSRPFTDAGAAPDVPAGRYVIFKPIAENFAEPMCPLGVDLFRPGLPPGYRFIRGRIYLDLDVHRRLWPFAVDAAQFARHLYLADVPECSLRKLDVLKLPLVLGAGCLAYLLFGVFFLRTGNLPDDFMVEFRKRCHRVGRRGSVDLSEMLRLLGLPSAPLLPAGLMPIQVNLTAPRYFVWLFVLRSLLRRWCPDLPAAYATALCAGVSGVKSMEMGTELAALAQLAGARPRVARLIEETPLDQLMAALEAEPAAADFRRCLSEFLAQHGHRAHKEFELSAPRWNEDPAPVLALVRNFLARDVQEPGAAREGGVRRAAAIAEIQSRLRARALEPALQWRWRILAFCVERTRYFTKLRENSRYHHIMIWQALRRRILQIEEGLFAKGLLDCRGDIFFLELDEIDALERGRLAPAEIEARIQRRHREFERECRSRPPPTIGIDEAAVLESGGDTAVLHGRGASPGIYEGPARVILDPAAAGELAPGEVLIAPYTDPSWTPLFLTASAAVIEVGSYLSHAGTVAREYAMPCVVDVNACTRRIASGTRVRVDGDRGSVTLLGEAPAP